MKTIRDLREEQPMTQFELAVAVGVTPGTVSNWERGNSAPRPAQLRQLAHVFGVSTREIKLVSKDDPSKRPAA